MARPPEGDGIRLGREPGREKRVGVGRRGVGALLPAIRKLGLCPVRRVTMKGINELACLAAVVCGGLLAAEKIEPRYKGKPLAYWMELLQKGDTDAKQKEAAEAISSLGPDA